MKEDKIQIICQNRKANHEYHILDNIECGIVLLGTEIKSIRKHLISLDGSYATIENNEVWLLQANIEPFGNASHQPKRKRKLLLKNQEVKKFATKSLQIGYTLIPLKVYLKNGIAKVELATCQGKQLHNKREAEKTKDAAKEMRKYR